MASGIRGLVRGGNVSIRAKITAVKWIGELNQEQLDGGRASSVAMQERTPSAHKKPILPLRWPYTLSSVGRDCSNLLIVCPT